MKKQILFGLILASFLSIESKKVSTSEYDTVKKYVKVGKNTNVSSLIGGTKFFGKKIVLYIYPEQEVTSDYLKNHILAFRLIQNGSNNFLNTKTQLIKNDHLLTLDDYKKYKDHQIVVLKKDCRSYWNNKVLHNVLKDNGLYGSKTVGNIKYSPFMLLNSDTNKNIMIYRSEPSKWLKWFNDYPESSWFTTLHRFPIAILIDEKGNVVHVLDNVQSENDIFNAFNIY